MTNESSKNSTNIEVQMNFQDRVTSATGKTENVYVNPEGNLADSVVEIQQLLQILDRSPKIQKP